MSIDNKKITTFSVNMGYYSIHPNIGGIFENEKEAFCREKHPINFKFRVRGALNKLADHIMVDILGVADSNAYIYEFTDNEEKSTNALFTPGNLFSLIGNKIKIAGDDADGEKCGVFFVPVEDPSKAVRVKRIAENSASKIIGIAPDTKFAQNRIEVRTRFTNSGTLLKEPRFITSKFIIEVAPIALSQS